MHCIPPCFRFPLFSINFQALWKILPFPEKFLDFYPPKFLVTFFSHRPQISNPPLFSLFQYIFPLFRENYNFPCFKKFPPCFRKIHLLFTYFMCFSFPPTCFDHDAFMHHPMHELDAPAWQHVCLFSVNRADRYQGLLNQSSPICCDRTMCTPRILA